MNKCLFCYFVLIIDKAYFQVPCIKILNNAVFNPAASDSS